MYKLHVERELACSHQLHNHDGKCRNLHGHNYTVIVDLATDSLIEGGSSDGMVMDFGDIKGVIDALDHRHLNDYFEMLKGYFKEGHLLDLVTAMAIQPTSERLAEYFARAIRKLIKEKYNRHACNIKVKVYESKFNYAEYALY